MQTINLKFEKLDRLPVPESRDEVLYCRNLRGDLFHIPIKYSILMRKDVFDDVLNLNNTYAHVKVTATETDFKVGDRVKWKGYNGEIVASLRESDNLLFEYKTPEFVMGFNGLKTNQVVVHPKDLTLIPNE